MPTSYKSHRDLYDFQDRRSDLLHLALIYLSKCNICIDLILYWLIHKMCLGRKNRNGKSHMQHEDQIQLA